MIYGRAAFQVECKRSHRSPSRGACNALLGGPVGLRGLITVNANQSTLSGIDAPIAGTCNDQSH